jgi:hypothetical protein
MIREEEFKTVIGQMAWTYYIEWFHASNRFKPSVDTFKTSSLYSQFISFAKFVKQVHIVQPLLYIKIMVKDTIPPSMWKLPDAHGLYISKLNQILTPLKLVDISITTLYQYSDDNNINVSNVFDVITPNEVILMLQRHNLSPWLLLKSKKFINYLKYSTNEEERTQLEILINFKIWHNKFSKHQSEEKSIKLIVSELNL